MPRSAQPASPSLVVVGCGSIGQRHIRNLLALGVRRIIAVDPRQERRDAVSAEFKIEAVDALDRAWAASPDAALIATPTSLHVPLALEAAQHHCHLFIEKPLSDRLDALVDRLLATVRDHHLVTLVGCNLRFHPGLVKVKQLLDEGAIGRIVAARVEVGQYLPDWHPWEDYRQGYSARRELGGGVILDAIHELDYIQWLLGEVREVSCFAGRLSRLEIDTEDTAAILLRFAGGTIGEVHLDYVQRAYSRACHLIGEEGTIRWDYTAGEVRCFLATTGTWQTYPNLAGWGPNQMYLEEMRHFLRCLAGEQQPLVDVAEGARVLALAVAAKTAAETGQVVHPQGQGGERARKVVAIIQARMGSTRLPGKVLAIIGDRPMLWHVVNRVRRAQLIDETVVATSTERADDAVAEFCAHHGIECFRGSETDVLDRFCQAARRYGATVIVRITADCPLVDPDVIEKVIHAQQQDGHDYVSNVLRPTYPDGLDCEVFTREALELAWREARLPTEREHVTPYLRTSGRVRTGNVAHDRERSRRRLRWTVDEPSDLEFVRAVYARLGSDGHVFGLEEVLRLLDGEPGLMDLNKEAIPNEGYYTSLLNNPPIPPKDLDLRRSRALREEAARVIPGCTQTFSKGPTQFVQGAAPVFLMRGQGSHVWDVDGNEYIDYPMALGPVILGHDYPPVTEAVMQQLHDGTTFSLPHPLEVELAELLTEIIPCAEMVRFGKNGSDATSGAIRVARAYTGRELVACCGYHGWQDWYIGTTTRRKGVPQAVQALTIPFEYNDLEGLQRIFDDHPGEVAAVIMEPVGLIDPQSRFLEQVRELARREGSLLIFDEVITGFRLALGGAQEHFGLTPDLACFGKAMANGYPLSAIVGRREIMRLFNEVFFSFTFAGETLSLAAAKATIAEMRAEPVIPYLWEQGQKLKDGYNVLAQHAGLQDVTTCIGLPPRTVITFKDATGADSMAFKSVFQQECLRRGVLFSGVQNVCYSHSDQDIEHTLQVYRTSLAILREAIEAGDVLQRLKGEPVQPVFRHA